MFDKIDVKNLIVSLKIILLNYKNLIKLFIEIAKKN